jgi:hypothetical protein
MKRILLLVTVAALLASTTLVFAVSEIGRTTTKMYKCCVIGKCVDASKEDCALKQGIIVDDCKKCKGETQPK